MHRNVIFRNATVPPLPISSAWEPRPKDLWRRLEAECLDAEGAPLTTDQRGLTRPVAIVGPEPRCDVGAYEVQPHEMQP